MKSFELLATASGKQIPCVVITQPRRNRSKQSIPKKTAEGGA